MPAMKPVLQKYFPRLLASTQQHTDSNTYYLDDSRSKPKRSRVTDPYNISRDSKSDSDSERRIVQEQFGGKSEFGGRTEIGVMGASYPKGGGEQITKTVEYGYEVTGDDNNSSMPHLSSNIQDEEAQMVRGRSPPRL